MKQKLPPKEYYESLAKVPSSGAALIRNDKGEFLILKQTYKDDWHLPGGMTDINETARQAVIREVQEEIGIQIEDARAFCVDFIVGQPFNRINFIFDCDIIDDEKIRMIKIDPDEVEKYDFADFEKLITILGPKIAERVKNSFDAFLEKRCIYIENGKPVAN